MFTIDDMIEEMRQDGTLTPEQEKAAEEIKAMARPLAEKYIPTIDAVLFHEED